MSVIYYYDGSYDGFMCCVFESVYGREIPVAIETFDSEQSTLFTTKFIETDLSKAERVKKSISLKICLEAKEMVELAFLSCMKDKEIKILEFMLLGYKVGGKVCSMLANDKVDVIKKAVLHLSREAHLFTGFIRFSQYDQVLMAQISPKNNVLPVIASHFCGRFCGETFMIFDNVHKLALVYSDGKSRYIHVENIKEPQAGPEEIKYRSLWKKFYDSIGIEERYNPKCRQTHMPKRYWNNMTEFRN